MITETQIKELIRLLDEAAALAGYYSGGYSGKFLSAEEFHAALTESIRKLKALDYSQLERLYVWFLPTSCWDDFTGMEGFVLGNQISELLGKIRAGGF